MGTFYPRIFDSTPFGGLPRIDHFTVVCLVSWPLNECEAGVDFALIETSLLSLRKFLLISMRTTLSTQEKQ